MGSGSGQINVACSIYFQAVGILPPPNPLSRIATDALIPEHRPRVAEFRQESISIPAKRRALLERDASTHMAAEAHGVVRRHGHGAGENKSVAVSLPEPEDIPLRIIFGEKSV